MKSIDIENLRMLCTTCKCGLQLLALCFELYKNLMTTCFCDYKFSSLEIQWDIESSKEEKRERKTKLIHQMETAPPDGKRKHWFNHKNRVNLSIRQTHRSIKRTEWKRYTVEILVIHITISINNWKYEIEFVSHVPCVTKATDWEQKSC